MEWADGQDSVENNGQSDDKTSDRVPLDKDPVPLDQQQPTEPMISTANTHHLNTFGLSGGPLWNDFASFDCHNPFEYENLTQLFWFPEVFVSDDVVLGQGTSTQNSVNGAHGPNGVDNTVDPYADWVHSHPLKKGPTVEVIRICDFLHDSKSWAQIHTFDGRSSLRQTLGPVVADGLRDTVSSRIHVMVSKALDQDLVRKIPHLFPPLQTVQAIFAECHRNLALLYPMVHPSTFFESTWAKDEAYSDIGLFFSTLMALGCLTIPVPEARSFAIQLAFLIRNMINETMTRDENQINDIWTMSTALLVTVLSAWCGNKRHAELAEAFRGTFSTAFLRRGYFKSAASVDLQSAESSFANWGAWISRERKTRMGYVWYIVEQEIGLFHCLSPTIHFSDMRSPIPCADELFFAETEEEWRALVERYGQLQGPGNHSRLHPPSLAAFYCMFLRHDFLELHCHVTALQLRLLLCAIQTQVTQFVQSNRFVSTEPYADEPHLESSSFASLRQEELQTMLIKWYILSQRVLGGDGETEMTLACKLIYHLVWLELLICFSDIQLLAGREGPAGAKPLIPQFQRWVRSPASLKALAHVGQVLKVLQCPEYIVLRPLWWPIALFRVSLIMWAYGIGCKLQPGRTQQAYDLDFGAAPRIPLNDPEQDFGPHGRVLRQGEGIPCVLHATGLLTPVTESYDALKLCLDLLEEGRLQSTPICEDVYRFLQAIRQYDFVGTKP
ncbi:Fungal specific transcription factor domain-containing protein [Cladophialophora immunda]|nr:Fungal specific transcription factor domain-containing protein [Cladophialophora immunda]